MTNIIDAAEPIEGEETNDSTLKVGMSINEDEYQDTLKKIEGLAEASNLIGALKPGIKSSEFAGKTAAQLLAAIVAVIDQIGGFGWSFSVEEAMYFIGAIEAVYVAVRGLVKAIHEIGRVKKLVGGDVLPTLKMTGD